MKKLVRLFCLYVFTFILIIACASRPQPEKRTEIETPVLPIEPVTPILPTEPVPPDVPVLPEVPVIPETPVQPTEPVIPGLPEAPVIPEIPVTPEVPEQPVTPVPPEVTVIPEIPVVPDIPVIPETPVQPTEPVQPTDPVPPEVPVIPEAPAEIAIAPVPPAQPPEIIPTPVERLVQRIKRNEDIAKHFVPDTGGHIIVKADIRNEAGNFEVIYNLDNARVLGNSTYEVRFTLRNTRSGTVIADTLTWRPRSGNAGILLSFDDDHFQSWERHFDLFDRYGAKVTFFVQGRFNTFATRAISRGHDIGYHSLNHPDLRGTSRANFNRETIEQIESFRQAGVSLSAFAFPYGFSEPWMHSVLLQNYSILRGYGVTFRLFRTNEIRSAVISSRAIDNTVIRGEENFNRVVTSMLRAVKFLDGNWVLPLTSHEISNADWGITPRRLEFVLQTARDLELRFYRYSDFGN